MAAAEREAMTTFQQLLQRELYPVPRVLLEESPMYLGSEDLPKERYYSREFHDLEVARLWPKVWQMACRQEDIPNVGDYTVYDIVRDSIVVIRVAPDRIKAYHNACLHRGTQLCSGAGNAPELRCSFHGWTWSLDGTLKTVPCRWDFPHVRDDAFRLPECQVETWGGFIFINMDPACEPLESYLENIPDHFQAWPLEQRWQAVHVCKVIRANWKVAHEAFLESYHVIATHPQGLSYIGDANTQYDIYGRHNRMLTAFGVASPHLGEVDEQQIAEDMARDLGHADPASVVVGDGQTARRVVADALRHQTQAMTGVDTSSKTDTEMLDAIQYFVFPNLYPWAGGGGAPVYRFRPNGDDTESCLMDLYLLLPLPDGAPRPPAVGVHHLGPDDSWTLAAELGPLGAVFDQDNANLEKIQRGVHFLRKPGVTLGDYQESRVRHFHDVLMRYLDAGEAPAARV